MTAPRLCPTCCHDHGHRLRSSAGPILWRPGLVRSAAYLAHEASWTAWQRAITATYDINHDLADEIRRYLRDHPPQPPAEADWLMDCPTCHGTGRDPTPPGGTPSP